MKLKFIFEWFKNIIVELGASPLKLNEYECVVDSPRPIPPITTEEVLPEPAPHRDPLGDFCAAIRDFEGAPPSAKKPKGDLNYKNNNPGNCRCSPAGYLPKYGDVKCVNNFAVFPTYELGWEYLKNMVYYRALKFPNWTFVDFFKVYAPTSDGNHPESYAAYVAKRCGVPVNKKVADFFKGL